MDFLHDLALSQNNIGSSTGSKWISNGNSSMLQSFSPVDKSLIGSVSISTDSDYQKIVSQALLAFEQWRNVPAPNRGELVRLIGQEFRKKKAHLGALISHEMGKPIQEGLGEVQEMIDMADFAVGQSRMLHGLTIASERSEHRMMEQYQPLGLLGVITAFNFPMAVWAWNALLGVVCGDVVLWKPSSKTPLCGVAIHKIVADVMAANDFPEGIFSLVTGGGHELGQKMVQDHRLPIISFTGSTQTGRSVATGVASRFGRTILELGGNNGVIVTADADLSLAVPGIVFGAIGTSGQRCTSSRRIIVHDTLYPKLLESLKLAYSSLKIGPPLDPGNHMGPLVDEEAVRLHYLTVERALQQGGELLYGQDVPSNTPYPSPCYVEPVLIKATPHMEVVQRESFVPVLYLIPYSGSLQEAIRIHNDVPQGLSSAIFTTKIKDAERFLAPDGSDCGIANVNIGTSGAEIGGAFGGEKETGGGREAGSDAWKAYMRRQTATINYGSQVPLAQGITFKL